MTISYCEHRVLTCPTCRHQQDVEVWLVLDAQEHPSQVAAVLQGKLNTITCSQCGRLFEAGTLFLFHDRATRCVICALSQPSSHRGEESHWREQAREMHALLLARIPAADWAAYLQDIQIAQDMAGVAHSLQKAARLQGRTLDTRQQGASATAESVERQRVREPESQRVGEPPATYETRATERPDNAGHPDDAGRMEALEMFLMAGSLEEVRAVVERHPSLLEPESDRRLEQLADMAFEQRDYALAEGLSQARQVLQEVAGRGLLHPSGDTVGVPSKEEHPATRGGVDGAGAGATGPTEGTAGAAHIALCPSGEIPCEVYHTLIELESTEELIQAINAYPIVLEDWFETALEYTIDDILDEGSERLALVLEHRREQITLIPQRVENGVKNAQTYSPV